MAQVCQRGRWSRTYLVLMPKQTQGSQPLRTSSVLARTLPSLTHSAALLPLVHSRRQVEAYTPPRCSCSDALHLHPGSKCESRARFSLTRGRSTMRTMQPSGTLRTDLRWVGGSCMRGTRAKPHAPLSSWAWSTKTSPRRFFRIRVPL